MVLRFRFGSMRRFVVFVGWELRQWIWLLRFHTELRLASPSLGVGAAGGCMGRCCVSTCISFWRVATVCMGSAGSVWTVATVVASDGSSVAREDFQRAIVTAA